MTQAGLTVGSEIRLGATTFTIVGALKKYPGLSPFTSMFAPRIEVSMAALRGTGLLQRGSLSQHNLYLKLPAGADAEALKKTLRDELRGERLGFTTAEERKEQLGDALKNLFSFVSLVGFLALFLGAVGVASAMHVFIRQRLATVAVLRCLGASARTSFAIYLVQGLGLGLVGSLLGAGAGLVLQAALPVLLKDYVPYQIEFVVSWRALLTGLGAGVSISALFTLLPLLNVRRVAPLHVLRSGFEDDFVKPDPLRYAVYAAIGAAMWAVGTLQTSSWRLGLAFSLAMIASFAVLAGVAEIIIWAGAAGADPRAALYLAAGHRQCPSAEQPHGAADVVARARHLHVADAGAHPGFVAGENPQPGSGRAAQPDVFRRAGGPDRSA